MAKVFDGMGCGPAQILFLTLNSSLGGTEKSLLSLCARLDKSAFRPFIVTLIGDGRLTRMARDYGVEALDLGMRGAFDARALLRLHEVFRARNISILHTFIYHTGILGRLMGWAHDVPVRLCSARSTDDWRSPLHVALDRFTQGFVHGYVANCQAVARRLETVENIHREKMHVVRTGIEALPTSSPEARRRIRAQFDIPEEAFVIGSVANMREAKGHDLLVAAAKDIVARAPRTIFLCVGDGPLRADVQRAITTAGLQRNFRLAGFLENPAPVYSAFDLFVLPSRWEGLPLAVMEAMSAGLPIVSTRVGGVDELIHDGVEGRLVTPGDAAALAGAIHALSADRDAARRMGASARQRFITECSLERYVGQMQNLYEDFLH